ncbi:hypothetical protein [Streptomyces sp. 7N604]|uniref:hypothetical protein n=1 Tax=Streptomyces sp. 7N604 TaxID=3457415 RepID=UPI003FD57283
MEPLKLVVVSAGLGRPSSTRLLAGRLAEATGKHLDGESRTAGVRVVDSGTLRGAQPCPARLAGRPGGADREILEATPWPAMGTVTVGGHA